MFGGPGAYMQQRAALAQIMGRGGRPIVSGAPVRAMRRRGVSGLGSPATVAEAQRILQATYPGAQCRAEEVGYPGGSYVQEVCSAPGFIGGMMVDAILQNRSTGGGQVDLAAQRAWDVANGGQHADNISYYTTIGKDSVPIFTGDGWVNPNKAINYTPQVPDQTNNSGANYPVNAQLQNLSRADGSFRVGDKWRLTITGKPNSAVTAVASQNGSTPSSAPFGNTDSSGRRVIEGQFDQSTVGTWAQTWTVAGNSSAINFTVQAAAALPPGTTTTGTTTGTPQTLPAIDLGSMGGTVNVFGFDVPMWALLGGGVAALFAFGGRR